MVNNNNVTLGNPQTPGNPNPVTQAQNIAIGAGAAAGAIGWLGSYVVTAFSSASTATLIVSAVVPAISVGTLALGFAKDSTALKVAAVALWPVAIVATKALGFKVTILTPVAGLAVGASVTVISLIGLGIVGYQLLPKLPWKNAVKGFI